ncbi:MAG: HAD-IA family hydrolase [Candidatus Eisenbacteria bacterium]|nr:HAD-IA family hydrolase [Candidatus Eisenbacteria bacterium]
MLRAVILDLDNTLTDFMRMKEVSIDSAIEEMIDAGLGMTREEAKRKLFEIYDREGIEDQRVFDKFLEQELGEIDPMIHTAAIIGYRRGREYTLVLYPHVKKTLLELAKRGLKLAVISDAPRYQAWSRLCYLQLQHFFDHVITFEDTQVRKPAAAPFKRAIELLQMRPDEVIMVGDWPERDMVGAHGVGIRTVYARYGDTSGAVVSGADYEIGDISELVGIVDRLMGRAGQGDA